MNRTTQYRHPSSFLKKTCLSVLVALALGTTAQAQQVAQPVQFSVQAGDLVQVINEISRSSGVQIVYDIDLLRGAKAGEVKGALTVEQALDRALSGSGLRWKRVGEATIAIEKGAEKPAGSRKSAAAKPKAAAAEAEEDVVQALDEMIVVGSRLGGSPVESAMPIKVITRDDIDRSGASSIAQMLTYLPEVPINNGEERALSGLSSLAEGANTNSTTVQMRGMPRGTTLVLINGRRAGDSPGFSSSGFFDLSTIPLALVERIEVLPAGSSAVYGGDALAGVINVVLRRDASGLELRIRRDAADGYGSSQGSAMWGKSWSRGSMTLTGSWSKQSGLYNHEREMTASMDFRRFGGRDQRQTAGYPATVYSLDGCPVSPYSCSVPLDQRNPLPGLDSATAVVPVGSNGKDLKPEDFLATQGQISKETPRRHLVSPEERYGIHANGHFELRPDLEAFGEFTYTRREIPASQAMFFITGGQGGHPTQSLVPADHPFNPFGVPVGVDLLYKDTGIFVSYSQDHYRGALGLRGSAGRFDWEVSGWQSRDTSDASGGTAFDRALVVAALQSTDPAKTINPFVSDGSPVASPEVLRSLMTNALSSILGSRTSGVTGFVRGPVAELPAGTLTALLGGERQAYTLDIDSNSWTLIAPQVHGRTTSQALFGEFRAPILSAREGQRLERIAVTGALRRETSDRFAGAALTKTFGIEMRPWDSLMLRSTYSTGFRPLVMHAMAQDPYESIGAAYDPKFGGQLVLFNARSHGGAADGLRPETSRTVTMGLVYQPSYAWTLSATHWNIKFFDQITGFGSQWFVDNEDLYPGRVKRNATTGVIEYVDSRLVNVSLRDTAGVDISLDGEWATPIGTVYPALAATYTYRFDQQLAESFPVTSNVSIYDRAGWAPRWKIVPRIGWDYKDVARTMLVGRYVSEYRDSSTYSTGPEAGTYPMLGDFWTFDINVDLSLDRIFKGQRYLSGTRLSFGANNLFDRGPEFCAGCSYTGYDASQYDIMGRKVYAEIRMSF